MFPHLSFKPLFWPTFQLFLMVPILIGLGLWQMKRLVEKERYQASVQQAKTLPQLPLNEVHLPFRHAQVHGVFEFSKKAIIVTPLKGKLAYALFLPIILEKKQRVWVRFALAPTQELLNSTIEALKKEPVADIRGILRPSQKLRIFSVYTHGLWLRPFIEKMNQHYFTLASNEVSPLWLDATALAERETFEIVPHHHLQYAWTWWSFAFTLVVIYFIYHYQKGRLHLWMRR